MVVYDSSVIVAFADRLYRQADSLAVAYAILGGLVGGAVGAMIGGAAGSVLVFAIAAAVLIGAIGFQMGQQKAFTLRLQAQTALCQVQIEENTRKTLH